MSASRSSSVRVPAIAKLKEQLKSAKAEKFGRRRSKSKDDDDNGGMSSSDRDEAEENFDGNECQSGVESVSDSKESRKSAVTGQTFNVENRPETYLPTKCI